jgi:glutamate carboxypeptidase
VSALELKLGMPEQQAADRVLATTRRYVERETPSRAAAALTTLSEEIEADLRAAGADVERREAPGLGRNLRAVVPGREAELRPVVVLAHIDTVHPIGTLSSRPFRVADGLAYGPGIYDMKSGLATVVEALAGLHARGLRPRRPVHLLVTCDEEIGSHSAYDLIVEEARGAAAVLVPEPCLPDGGVKTFRKGVATYRVDASGCAAHAGIDGATDRSAIAELVRALHVALRLADHGRGTTINVGMIGGGTASNVVPADAWALLDVRLAEAGEDARIHEALCALATDGAGTSLVVTRTENRPPLLRTEGVVALHRHARAIAAELGVELGEGASGGGSDGSIAASAGAATLDGLGPMGAGAHAEHEHIVLADLPFRLALMSRLLETL